MRSFIKTHRHSSSSSSLSAQGGQPNENGQQLLLPKSPKFSTSPRSPGHKSIITSKSKEQDEPLLSPASASLTFNPGTGLKKLVPKNIFKRNHFNHKSLTPPLKQTARFLLGSDMGSPPMNTTGFDQDLGRTAGVIYGNRTHEWGTGTESGRRSSLGVQPRMASEANIGHHDHDHDHSSFISTNHLQPPISSNSNPIYGFSSVPDLRDLNTEFYRSYTNDDNTKSQISSLSSYNTCSPPQPSRLSQEISVNLTKVDEEDTDEISISNKVSIAGGILTESKTVESVISNNQPEVSTQLNISTSGTGASSMSFEYSSSDESEDAKSNSSVFSFEQDQKAGRNSSIRYYKNQNEMSQSKSRQSTQVSPKNKRNYRGGAQKELPRGYIDPTMFHDDDFDSDDLEDIMDMSGESYDEDDGEVAMNRFIDDVKPLPSRVQEQVYSNCGNSYDSFDLHDPPNSAAIRNTIPSSVEELFEEDEYIPFNKYIEIEEQNMNYNTSNISFGVVPVEEQKVGDSSFKEDSESLRTSSTGLSVINNENLQEEEEILSLLSSTISHADNDHYHESFENEVDSNFLSPKIHKPTLLTKNIHKRNVSLPQLIVESPSASTDETVLSNYTNSETKILDALSPYKSVSPLRFDNRRSLPVGLDDSKLIRDLDFERNQMLPLTIVTDSNNINIPAQDAKATKVEVSQTNSLLDSTNSDIHAENVQSPTSLITPTSTGHSLFHDQSQPQISPHPVSSAFYSVHDNDMLNLDFSKTDSYLSTDSGSETFQNEGINTIQLEDTTLFTPPQAPQPPYMLGIDDSIGSFESLLDEVNQVLSDDDYDEENFFANSFSNKVQTMKSQELNYPPQLKTQEEIDASPTTDLFSTVEAIHRSNSARKKPSVSNPYSKTLTFSSYNPNVILGENGNKVTTLFNRDRSNSLPRRETPTASLPFNLKKRSKTISNTERPKLNLPSDTPLGKPPKTGTFNFSGIGPRGLMRRANTVSHTDSQRYNFATPKHFQLTKNRQIVSHMEQERQIRIGVAVPHPNSPNSPIKYHYEGLGSPKTPQSLCKRRISMGLPPIDGTTDMLSPPRSLTKIPESPPRR